MMNRKPWDSEFFAIMDLAHMLMMKAVAEEDIQSPEWHERKGCGYQKKNKPILKKIIFCKTCDRKMRVANVKSDECSTCKSLKWKEADNINSGAYKYCYYFGDRKSFATAQRAATELKREWKSKFTYFTRKYPFRIYTSEALTVGRYIKRENVKRGGDEKEV